MRGTRLEYTERYALTSLLSFLVFAVFSKLLRMRKVYNSQQSNIELKSALNVRLVFPLRRMVPDHILVVNTVFSLFIQILL